MKGMGSMRTEGNKCKQKGKMSHEEEQESKKCGMEIKKQRMEVGSGSGTLKCTIVLFSFSLFYQMLFHDLYLYRKITLRDIVAFPRFACLHAVHFLITLFPPSCSILAVSCCHFSSLLLYCLSPFFLHLIIFLSLTISLSFLPSTLSISLQLVPSPFLSRFLSFPSSSSHSFASLLVSLPFHPPLPPPELALSANPSICARLLAASPRPIYSVVLPAFACMNKRGRFFLFFSL